MMLIIPLISDDAEKDKLTILYNEHKVAMMKVALNILKDTQRAEDAVHVAFLAIIKHKAKYFNLSCRDFRFSCVHITKNVCLSILRTQKHYADEDFDEMASSFVSEDKTPEEEAILYMDYEAICSHLDSIDEISRHVLVMKYFHGMSYKEIGTELDLTPKHVETRISRAKEKVRKLINKSKARCD
jgi:RNA polymerase sigma-70 factor (ECF subfamily)